MGDMVAATSLTLEEGIFLPGDELPASALKYLDDEHVMKKADFDKQEKAKADADKAVEDTAAEHAAAVEAAAQAKLDAEAARVKADEEAAEKKAKEADKG